MTFFSLVAIRQIWLLLVFPGGVSSVCSQEVEWAYSDGGHVTECVWGMELVGEDILYFTTTGLQKMDSFGNLIWRFDFFDLDQFPYSPRPALGATTADEEGNTYAQLSFPASELFRPS